MKEVGRASAEVPEKRGALLAACECCGILHLPWLGVPAGVELVGIANRATAAGNEMLGPDRQLD